MFAILSFVSRKTKNSLGKQVQLAVKSGSQVQQTQNNNQGSHNFMLLKTFSGLIAVAFLVSAHAAEFQPFGQIHGQLNYQNPQFEGGNSWALTTPEAYMGLIAFEPLDAGSFGAGIQAGLETSSETAVLTQEEAYLYLQQPAFTLYGGLLTTLEQAYLADNALGLKGLEEKGLASMESANRLFGDTQGSAFRLEAASGDGISVATQWVFDEQQTGTPWSAATLLSTVDGMLAVTYHKMPNQDGVWGNMLRWVAGNSALSTTLLYQSEVLAWDATFTTISSGIETTLQYADSQFDGRRWSIGAAQVYLPTLRNYTELSWYQDQESWLWAIGFAYEF